ncbi:mechanosensitive ion channel family protein [Amylibacter sp. SFDW26]|uniref:DUF3772 domain-containing protein n=1 Tax=Amylibacter sp. SFDW26 TaxID=2652722 RepID=UPI0012619CB2|nr:DUF3772 domain-containing protein [Amylibacter sp. SFDW26]KAB7616137.1 mechanosensitive ion channel family protein [Amylibacter sp. SFDW26]
MTWLLKRLTITLGVVAFIACAAFAQNSNNAFDIEQFRELASRAESVVSNGQASTEALEILRSDLVKYRAQALSSQEARARRVATVQEQIAVLGAVPEEGQQETEQVTARRTELNGQLAEARAPLIVSQEAFRRAGGLISEIDKIIRARNTTALLQLDSSPLNPKLWPNALSAFTKYIGEIGTEVKTQWDSATQAKVRKQNGPIILILIALSLILMVPVRNWVTRGLETANDESLRSIGDVPRLLASLAVFLLPMFGLLLLVAAIELAELFALRGDLLMRSVPIMGLSFFGANWLARNLPQGKIYSGDNLGEEAGLVVGGQRTIVAIGIVMAVFYFVDGLSKGAEWPTEILSVIRFPFIVLLGYGVFRLGRKIKKVQTLLNAREEQTGIRENISRLLSGACYIAGLGGPLLAAFGYSNAGATLIFSMVLTLALIAALFFIYILLVRLMLSGLHRSSKQQEDVPSGGLYKVLLAFLLICFAVPLLALIWGARVSDLTNVWFILNEGISLGDTRISVSHFLIFIPIFFIGYTITRLMQTALRTAVLPNTKIESGAQNALVTGFGYIGIFLSALIAIMTTGLDLSNLAIVAGALSVGIGFGLQAIVSNFVSGIILLIERPVKIGDWVEVGGNSGNISKISVRSTSIETFDRATVIIPNADLIAGTVTNWTHDNLRGRVKAPVGVAYGTDPRLVEEVLLSIAAEHPNVLKLPKPWVVFKGFGADSMDFELRAIIRDVNNVLDTLSDFNYAIVERFTEEGIEIPFAQREVRIKNAQDFLPPTPKTTRKAVPKPKK